MFNLELAVHQWCVAVLSEHAINSKKLDELKDHLYCSIEAGVDAGKSEQEAFNDAISGIGEVEILKEEFNKNRGFFEKLCAAEYGTLGEFQQRITGEVMLKVMKQQQIVQSILWASAILATSIVLREQGDTAFSVTMILLVLSTVSLGSLRQAFKKSKLEQKQ